MFCACVLCAHGEIASAQSASEPLPGRYEVAAGVSWRGPTSFGDADASLTAASGDRYRLFGTSTELAGAPGLDVRLGRTLTRVIQVELTAAYSSPVLMTSISHDLENGTPTVASESIREITIVGAAVVYLPRWRLGSQVLPFLSGGGGYLRQLHAGDTLAQGGGTYQVGGGAMIPIVSRGGIRGVKQFGVRADAQLLVRPGGVALDGRAHTSPSVTASLFARF